MRPALVALVVLAFLTAGCGGRRSAAADVAAAAGGPCPPSPRDTLGGRLSYVTFIVDGRVTDRNLRQVTRGTESAVMLDTARVLARARLHPEEILSITPVGGPAAESQYRTCPGVALLVVRTTRGAPR
jgi:hypothetical protein